jgi:putative glycosyltransferase (TIGR04348 family)
LVIVSPALAAANNGNWQTARRWHQLLAPHHRVRITDHWPDAQADGDAVMLALHARRSAAAVQAWSRAHGAGRLGLVLTGTDLYQDLAQDAAAQASLALAGQIVVLQDQAPQALPAAVRAKTRVIYQSTTARQPLPKSGRALRVVAVGHLRAVKSPQTLFAAAALLDDADGIRIEHVGAAEPDWAARARAAEAAAPWYRWLGSLPHAEARRRIQRAHLLVHPSVLEGGAHVVMEAVCSGTPVLASRVPGNVGMLGPDYEGYFPHGDAAALADLLRRCRAGQNDPAGGLIARLGAQCALRAPLFEPQAEQAALLRLVQDLLDSR